ncbi:MAG: C25 family cysteine peptidase [Thermodesulfobacteriota bacterium]
MRQFKSLQPFGLLKGFDAEIHGDAPIVRVEESKSAIVISYQFPGLFFTDQGRELGGEKLPFTGIDISKTGSVAESGKPLLPSFGRYVQIPFNCDYRIEVETGDATHFDNVLVSPAQAQETDEPNRERIFEFEKDFYAADQWYPEDVVKVTGPYEMDEYTALLVHVRPVQYNAAQKRLRGFGNITVTITLTPKKKLKEKPPSADPERTKEAFGNLFLNPRRGIASRLDIAPVRDRALADKTEPDFLIVYHDSLQEAARKLADWKTMLGLQTEAVSINAAGASLKALKTHIRARREAAGSRLRYVLLLGDVDMIPSEKVTGTAFEVPGYEPDNVTDYYYSTPRDPRTKEDLVFPWLSIGRIPVNTQKEANAVIEKIIAYEGNPPGDPEYYKRMSFAAYFQDLDQNGTDDRNYMKTLESIRDHLMTLGFQVQRVYVSDNPHPQFFRDGTPVPEQVKTAIMGGDVATHALILAMDEGQLVMAHRDHGYDEGWAHPSFTNADLDAVSGKLPTPFFSVNCLTGHFDLANQRKCFAEKLVAMEAGAPSLIAATRVSQTWLNDALMKGVFDGLWAGVIATFPQTTASYPVSGRRLGDILNYGKSYLPISKSGSDWYIRDHFEIYHVVGDPTLSMWTEQPRTTKVEAKIAAQNLYVTLSDCPKGAVVTLWLEGKMLKRIEPSSTQFTISLRLLIPPEGPSGSGPLFVCFFAPGHRFVKHRVMG